MAILMCGKLPRDLSPWSSFPRVVVYDVIRETRGGIHVRDVDGVIHDVA